MEIPLRLNVPRGFAAVSIDGVRIVTCTRCDTAWHIPKAMDRISYNAWHLLMEHRVGHWPRGRNHSVRLVH